MVRRDLYEFNSIPYGRYDLKALYVLYDHAPLAAVRTAAAGVLDWMWAKLAVGENMRRSSATGYRRQPDPQRYGSGPGCRRPRRTWAFRQPCSLEAA